MKELSKILTLFVVKSITHVNHKPHPYMIGPKHIEFAADNYNGMLTEAVIAAGEKKRIYCAHPDCALPYDQHTSDKVLFLQLTRDLTNQEATEELMKVKPILEENKVDGVAFVETPEQFRITE